MAAITPLMTALQYSARIGSIGAKFMIVPIAVAAAMAGPGLFVLRLKLPKGYHIPPHTHPKPEVVTILSGTLRLGEGASADQSKADPLPAGSFFVMSPGMQHYVYADEETVLQLNSNGPWGLTYVNEKDDPRKTQ